MRFPKKIKLINLIKTKWDGRQARITLERAEKREADKRQMWNLLTKPMSTYTLETYNLQLILNSAGWIGGNIGEREMKGILFRENRGLFDIEEQSRIRLAITKAQK